MDEIQAEKPDLPDDRIQDRPADEENAFRLADSKPGGLVGNLLRPASLRFLVYSLLVAGLFTLGLTVGPIGSTPFIGVCLLLGWLAPFAREPNDDNPFKRKDRREPTLMVGLIAALVWLFVLIGRLLWS